MKNNTRTSLYILSVGLVLSLARFFLKTSNDLVLIMAIINIVAFNYVIYELINKIYSNYYGIIDKYRFAEVTKSVYKNKYKWFFRIIQIIIFFICSPIYLLYYCETANDILAILALCLSISTSSLSSAIADIMTSKL